jgi:hypothetical protein
MIEPRTTTPPDSARPTLPQPKSAREFGGWGPRLTY